MSDLTRIMGLVDATASAARYESLDSYLSARLALETALRELCEDQARYRWLRDQYRCSSLYADNQHVWTPKMAAILRGPSLDEAIDKAMQDRARQGE